MRFFASSCLRGGFVPSTYHEDRRITKHSTEGGLYFALSGLIASGILHSQGVALGYCITVGKGQAGGQPLPVVAEGLIPLIYRRAFFKHRATPIVIAPLRSRIGTSIMPVDHKSFRASASRAGQRLCSESYGCRESFSSWFSCSEAACESKNPSYETLHEP